MGKSIINVRRSSICWRGRRELITDVRNQKSQGCHCRRSYLLDYSDHLANLSREPKLKSLRGADATSFFPLRDAYRKQLGLKDFSPEKSGRCGIAAD